MNNISSEYLKVWRNIYETAFSDEYSIEDVIKRTRSIIPERVDEIIPIINQMDDVKRAKEIVINWLIELLVRYIIENSRLEINKITPWDLIKYRDEILTRIFNKSKNTLNITIYVNDKSYNHLLSEEFVYGLLIVLNSFEEFRIFLDRVQINMDVFTTKYREFSGKYSVKIQETEYEFMTPDFIHGVITGARWTNQDPHNIIIDLSEKSEKYKIPLNFI